MSISNAVILSFENKEQIASSDIAGCYLCLQLFDPKEVKDYTDKGKTAICPKCSIDAVIGSSSMKIDKDILKEIQNYWLK